MTGCCLLILDVQLVPIVRRKSSPGTVLPDYEALHASRVKSVLTQKTQGAVQELGSNLRNEQVARAFHYGQVAAFLRQAKLQGANLQNLRAGIVTASNAALI